MSAGRRLILLALSLLAAAGAAADTVRLGALQEGPAEQERARWQPLASYLGQQLPGRQVEVRLLDYPELRRAVSRRQVELVIIDPASHSLLARRGELSAPLASRVEAVAGKPRPAYGGVVLVRADGPLQGLDQLAGRTVAVPSRLSLGGYQAQLAALAAVTPRLPAAIATLETGLPHDSAVEALLAGRADAAFVRSGVLERMTAAGAVEPGALRVLGRQRLPHFPHAVSTRLYPGWLVAAAPHVGDDLARGVTAALLSLPVDGPVAAAAGLHGFTVPASYDAVVDLQAGLRLPPFAEAPAFTLGDVWDRYAGLMMALLAALVLAALLVRLSQQLALRRASLFRQLFERHSSVMLLVDADDGVIVDANDAASGFYGYDREQLRGMSITTINQLDPAAVEVERRRAMAEERNRFVFPHRLADGSVRTVEVQTAPVVVQGRTLLLSIIQDITEREEARARLVHEAEARRQLLSALGEGVYGTDATGRCTFINEAALDMLGFARDQVIGEDQHALFHHRRADGTPYPAADCPVHHTLLDGEPRVTEDWFARQDGSGFPVSLTATPLFEEGRRSGVVVVFRDISEQRRREQELSRLLDFREAMLDSSGVAVFLGAPDRTIRLANRRAVELLGYSEGELLGQSFRLLHLDQARFEAFGDHYQALDRGQVVAGGEWPFRRRDGSVLWCEVYGSTFDIGDGQGTVWNLVDVTARRQSEARNRLLISALEAAANAIVITDRDACIEWANPAFETLTGYSRAEAVGRRPAELVKSGGQDEAFYRELWGRIMAGHTWRGELVNRRKDGSLYTEEMIVAPVPGEEGEPGRFVGIKQDISERKRAERELLEAESRLRIFIERFPGGVLVEDEARRIVLVNQAFCDLFAIAVAPAELAGADCSASADQVKQLFADPAGFVRRIDRLLRARRPVMAEELAMADGRVLERDYIPVWEGERMVGNVWLYRDISERKRLEQELEDRATTDFLTGLANRRRFNELLAAELTRLKRFRSQRAALLMLDLDHFKAINDGHGHAAGDRVLQRFGELLRERMRATDEGGRLGGEEFALLLPGAGLEDALAIAEALRERVEQTPVASDGGEDIRFTISIGVTTLDAGDEAIDTALKRADQALYAAKANGRNRVETAA